MDLPDPGDDAAFRARLTFHVGTDAFDGANASWSAVGAEHFTWSPSGLTWADMQTIAVRLTMSVPGIDSFAFTDAGTDGTYGIGDAVEVTVTFSEAVTVTGTPQLEIDITGFPYPLNYSSGSGSTALVFSGLTVTSGLSAIYGIGIKANKLELNGGTIKASAGGSPDAVLDHAAVPLSSNRKIDGVRPELITTGDSVPKPSSDGTKVILTFSDDIGSVNRSKITVRSGTTTLATTADSTSAATVEITLESALMSSDTSVTVELDADAVHDLAGNGNPAVATTPVAAEDNIAPTLSNAFFASASLVWLEFGEDLDSSSVPDKSAFTVEVEGAERALDLVVILPGTGIFQLYLDSTMRPGETVTVSYAKPATDPLQDAAENEVVSFMDVAVRNNLAATAPDALGNLYAQNVFTAISPVQEYGDTLLLRWTTPWHNGRDITKYQYRYAPGTSIASSVTWEDIPDSAPGLANANDYRVTELTADTQYTFEVRAVNGIGNGAGATVTATTPMPTWELTLTDSTGNAVTELTEGGASATVTVRIAYGVTFTTAQTVTLEWDGLALDAGSPIQGAGGASAITIPPGQSSGTLVISAPDPGGVAAYDPPRTAPLWGRHGENQISGIDLTFRDDEEPPVATLTAQPSQVSEGGTINVEVSLNLPYGAHATSTLSLAVTDAAGALVAPLPTEAAFDAGELTHALTLTAGDNAVQNDGAREVTVALVENPDAPPYTLGDPSSVTVTVLDNDTPPSAPRNLAAEARDGEARLTWQAPLTDNGQAVTGYEYRQKAGTGSFGAWTDVIGSNDNATEYTVTSLANDTAYTFEVQAENVAGPSAASNQASATPVAGDSTAPVLRSATTTALELGLTYDENLDAGSEPAPSAFTATVDGASRAVTGISVDETKVRLTLASAVRAGETVTVSYTVPGTDPLRDEASNPAAAFSDHPVTNEVPATVPDAPSSLAATPGDGSVTLRWTASAHDGGSEVTSHQYRQKTTGDFGSWQGIELSAPGEANATSYPVTSLMNDTAYNFEVQARNEEGESGPSNQASATPVTGDSTAPMLQGATTTALELKLFYDENLDGGSEPAPSAFTVTVDGASRGVTEVSVDETKVLLTLASAVRAGETVTVSYTVPGTDPLQDEASNPAAAFSDHPVTNEVPATAPEAPTGLEATPGDGSVTLRWTASAHDGGSEVTSHQYRQKTTGGFGSWQDIELSAPGEANATSYPVTSLMNDTAYTFEVQARNAEGDSGPSNQARATPVAGDTTAPMLRSATTTALALGLTYDEDLDADSEPAPSAFTVTVDGASRAVTGVSVDGTKVVLTLATAVRAGETVTVTYAVPAMNPLRDEARNPAASPFPTTR